MIIDILLLLLLIAACLKGYSRGLIVAIFSVIAIVVGLAAAMKLSVMVAARLQQNFTINTQWLPAISFILVMIAVIVLVRIGANWLEKTAEFILMGWVNKIGGILLYAFIYCTVLSVLLFYAVQLQVIKQATINASITYPYLEPWGPKAVNAIGYIIPVFKNMFQELETFFSAVAASAEQKN